MGSIFKAYDIRGIYGEELTEKDSYLIAYYLANLTNLKEFKVSHDLRLSFEQLTKFFIQGLIDAGVEVEYLGANSTPCFYHSLFDGIDSGVQITASHNSAEYNGLKFMIKQTSFDSRNGLQDLEKLVKEDLEGKADSFDYIYESIQIQSLNEFLEDREINKNLILDKYVSYLNDFSRRILSDEDRTILKHLRIGFDFANGMSSQAITKLVKRIGLDFFFLNHKQDGSFPSHLPEPKYAAKYVEENVNEKFDLIFAFDGDGDRIGVVDENKEFVLMDYIIAFFIDYFVKNGGAKNFVCDLRASRVINEIAEKNDAKVELLRVGRSFYQDYLMEHNCKFGGELSGHLFFKDFYNLDNPDIALIYFLKILAIKKLEMKQNFKFSKIVEGYKKYARIPETNLVVSDANKVFRILEEKFKDKIVMRIDGLSFDFSSYWFNVRKSNTEPKIRINFEGNERENTQKEFDKLVELIKYI